MRKVYLIAVLLAGLPVFAAFFYPFIPDVAAADYGISVTNNIYIGGSSTTGECEKTYMPLNWAELMSDDPSAEWSYKNTWSYVTNYDNARQKLDEFHQRFVGSVATGSGWAVAMENTNKYGIGEGDSMAIRIILFDPPSSELKVDTTVNGRINISGGTFHVSSFYLNPHYGCRFEAGWDIGKRSNYIYVDTARPVFFIASDNIIYPSDYSGEHIPNSLPPARNYVALGDSFSSGEGNPPFEAGTENACHRSSSAYPRLLESSLYLNLTHFVACSGAITSDVANEGLEDQVSALSQDTDIITLTIGGNDVGFKDFATACTVNLCDFSTQAYQDIHNNILNDLPNKLTNTYQAIDNATSNDAKIYVLGYPHLAPTEMPTGANSACWPLNGGLNNPDPTQNNGVAVYAIQTQLNDVIQQAISNYGSSKFQYINPNGSNSPFIGHDWCKQDRYFTQVAVNQTSYSYHPNGQGHAAYASVLMNTLP